MEIEGCRIAELQKNYGTPFYLYMPQVARNNFQNLKKAFNGKTETEIAYSYKTNYIPEICEDLHSFGASPEVIAGFEYELSERLNQDMSKVIVNGP